MFARVVWLLVLSAGACRGQDQDSSQLTEGSPCWVGDMNGTCVYLPRCSMAATYYAYHGSGLHQAVINLPAPQHCAAREAGGEVVCCTDCYLDNGEEYTKKVPMVLGVKYNRKGPKAWRKCLEYFSKLPYPCQGKSSDIYAPFWSRSLKCNILMHQSYGLGGYAAQKDEFPHMALLGYGERREDAQWLCGGAVVSERYILTAAHCSSSPSVGPVTFAGLGVLKRIEVNDYWKVYQIQRIVKHPEYRAPFKYHDIALLQTTTEINFGKSLLPACLDFGQRFASWAQAPGWGRLGHRGRLAEHLMVMELNAYNDTLCSSMYPPHRLLKQGYNASTQMCYGRMDKVVDTCEGDSGGPLQSGEYLCVYYVVGVTSYGKDCGIPGSAGMYTRVAHYVPWIESVVWPDP